MNTEIKEVLARVKGVGKISAEDAIQLGLSGAALRASGVPWDIRKSNPYLVYDRLDWEMIVGKNGDVYERYIVRMKEMLQSVRIVRQCIDQMPTGGVSIDNPKIFFPPREKVQESMESLIHHFLLASEGFQAPKGEVYFSVEAPKGEFGFYLFSDGGPKPYRLKIRSPSFINLQALEPMAVGQLFADVVAIIGSLDIVMGEVDR